MTESVTFHPKELNEVSGGTKEETNQNFEMHTKTKSGIELRFVYGKSVLEVSFRTNASFETLWQATAMEYWLAFVRHQRLEWVFAKIRAFRTMCSIKLFEKKLFPKLRKSSFAHFHRINRDQNLWFQIVGLIKVINVSYQRTHSMWSSSKDPLPLTTAYPSKCVDFYKIFGGKVIKIRI